MSALKEYCSGIFQQHSGKLLRFIRRVGGGNQSEDILQDVFIRFIREANEGRIRPGGELPWLYRAARNLTIDYFRKSRRNISLGDSDFQANGTPTDETLFREEILHRMFAVAAECGQDYVTLLHLMTETRVGQAHMAKAVGKSERTVRRMIEKLFTALEFDLKDWKDLLSP
ncbi:MAG: sigma-70 family RNA polymerase sigma factor [Spirochaetia bacterium]|nr:sigma-70 family RNA polymerase sigma factor [Spirochaetia bacterium]